MMMILYGDITTHNATEPAIAAALNRGLASIGFTLVATYRAAVLVDTTSRTRMTIYIKSGLS